MAFMFKITPANVGHYLVFFAREARRALWDKMRGSEGRAAMALDYVKKNATEGDPDSVLRALDEFGSTTRFLMNVGDEKGRILDQAVRDSGAGRALEIGCFCGYSAVRTAKLLDKPGSILIGLEMNPKFAQIARETVAFAGLSGRVDIRVGPAQDSIPDLGEPFDVVFIDHWKDRYLPDLLLLEEHGLLHDGTIVVADNVGIFENSVQNYLDHVRTSPHYDSTHHAAKMEYHHAIEDGVEISVWKG